MINDRINPTRPHVGVGAVIWRDNEVLLIQRGKDPGKGKWSLPGGGQELGETVAEAVIREILEETNLRIQLGQVIDVVDAIVKSDEGDILYHYTLIDYAARYVSGTAKADSDVEAVRWVTPAELATYDLMDRTIEIIEKSKGYLP
ncbi:MAG: NUDIX hydrolase [Sneathiella sp.]|nr:NUDIX hydrolase [Sneathiella sp.]